MNEGWIKLHRKFLKSAIWESRDSYLIQLFTYCLFEANWKDKEVVMGNEIIKLKRGQFITGRKSLVIALTKHRHEKKQIFKKYEFLYRRKLFLLEKLNFLHIKSTNKYTVITVQKYNEYQVNAQQMHNNDTTDAQQMHTTKEYKNIRIKEYTDLQVNIENVRIFLKDFLYYWNLVLNTKYQTTAPLEENALYWLGHYTGDQVYQAVKNIPRHEYWKDKMTPTVFFRKSNPRREKVDYIGELLNLKVKNGFSDEYKVYKA